MYKIFVPVCAFAATAVTLGTMPAHAQDDDSLFEEITVTATKREQNIYEVPIALSAFDGDKLAKQGISNLVDVGKFVPNLNVTSFSGGQVSSVNPFIDRPLVIESSTMGSMGTFFE